MPMKPLDRLMFAQGGLCFFCRKPLPRSEASVEHLVASSNGGSNNDENCVACCKALNALLGSMSLREKIQVVLNQQGHFQCPNDSGSATSVASVAAPTSKTVVEKLDLIVSDLQKRGHAKPRTLRTLGSTVSSLFKKALSEQEVSSLIERLKAKGVVVVTGTKVSYELPPKNA